jgi:DNA-binding response OmpR family regulator
MNKKITLKTKQYTILIVEDETSLRNALRDKFVRKGFSILEAKDGEEGLAVALKNEPNMILLDIIMPKMDGMTMLKKLRQENKWSKNVPVMLLSNLGGDDEKMMMEIEKDRLVDYLVKSNWSLDDVVKKVKEKLS